MAFRYFEDFQVGEVMTFGPHRLSEESILAFAREFDPQPFHIDLAAAEKSPFGGLIASGWHTGAVVMRLVVDGLLTQSASLGSPGMDEVRWLKPVRPGDALTAKLEILEAKPSASRADRGTLKVGYDIRNQRDESVMTMTARVLFGRRPVG